MRTLRSGTEAQSRQWPVAKNSARTAAMNATGVAPPTTLMTPKRHGGAGDRTLLATDAITTTATTASATIVPAPVLAVSTSTRMPVTAAPDASHAAASAMRLPLGARHTATT